MIYKTKFFLIALFFILTFAAGFLLRTCQPDPGEKIKPIVAVTPITNPVDLKKYEPLPGDEKPRTAVPVKIKDPNIGYISEPAVVVSDKGNTFVVYAQSVDWGFRCIPKLSVAISDDFLIGADVSFFSWWRLNADALLFFPISNDFSITQARAGAGVSGQVTANTSAGICYLKNFADKSSWAVFVSMKF